MPSLPPQFVSGSATPLPPRLTLRAGPLSLVYEAGDLRYVRLGEREVLRRVYAAVRDRNWGTVPAQLAEESVETGENRFRISYLATHRQDGIDFRWRATITGDEQGRLRFSMEGQAHSTFWRNRIGFCVLLPIQECAGQPCLARRADSPPRQGTLPLEVVPAQPVEPFAELTEMEWEAGPGVRACLRFQGELFEMEDQRNWTDASYKVFCTPLRLPFPVQISAGTPVSQAVELELEGRPASAPHAGQGPPLTLSLEEGPFQPLPALGLGMASHGQPLGDGELELLRRLHLSHLRVDLRLDRQDWETALRRAHTEALALGAGLEVALHLSDQAEEELRALVALCAHLQPRVSAWLVFHRSEKSTTRPWAALARQALKAWAPAVPVGGGTDADFYQLNQFRPPAELLDFLSFGLTPQAHAFDNPSLVETLEAQAYVLDSARRYFPDKPLAISPVVFKYRFNPVATGPQPEPPPGQLPPQVDLRQLSLFGAAWTLGSLRYLGAGGLDRLTWYETSGWRGVIERPGGSPLPGQFPSIPGAAFPLYHVLAWAGEFAGGQLLPLGSTEPLAAVGLALRRGRRTRLLLANLQSEVQEVQVSGLGNAARVRLLDQDNLEAALLDPAGYQARAGAMQETRAGTLSLPLLPYACTAVDLDP